MADIRIKTRRPRATWPWLLVLALPFAYLLTWGMQGDVSARTASASDTAGSYIIPRDTVRAPDSLELLQAWASGADSAGTKADARGFAAIGLERLVAATELLGAAGAPTNQKTLMRVRGDAQRILDRKRVSDNVAADRMHDAAVGIADVLETANVAGRHGADALTQRTRVAAGDIHVTASLDAQRAQVQQFLQAASAAIAAMHPSAP